MLILILGVALWWAPHFFKRIAPEQRAEMGQKGKGLIAAVLVVSIILMIIGYRMADGPVWWGPTPALKGINNLLVLVAVYLFAAAGMKTAVTRHVRHPQLTGFALWAVAHLLVNGDLPSFVLFGGLLLWAVAEMLVLNRVAPDATPAHPLPAAVPARKEAMAAMGAVVVFLIIGGIHAALGYNPFGG